MNTRLPTILADSAPYLEEYDPNDIWYFPLRTSDYAKEVDITFYVEYAICFVFCALIYILTVWFCVKYRRKEGDAIPPHITHNWPLEITWTILPTIICFGMFYVGAGGYLKVMGDAPKDANIVNVYAQQWSWQFEQKGSKPGMHKSPTLILEKDQPVQLRMISNDVLHSLFMPGMREKMDVVPNRITTLNILPIRVGTYNVYCTEYCGDKHSQMITTVTVLERKEFLEAIIPKPEMNPYNTYKQFCSSCHNLTDATNKGPSWKGLWTKVGKGTTWDGKEIDITVNEAYITESIRDPKKIIRRPFPNLMGPFTKSQISDVEVTAIVEWIKKGKFEEDLKWDLEKKEFVKDE